MKQATALVKMSKEQEVTLTGITPFEALLLTAEHHRNVGGVVVEVQKDTIKDGTNPKWSIDDEAARLRQKYHSSKVDAILAKVRDIPTEDYEKATQLGVNVVMPSTSLSSTKIL